MSRPFLSHVITDDSALGGSVIERSLRFRSGATAYLERNVTSSSNRKTHTFSTWIKRCKFGDYHLIYTQGDNAGNEQFYMFFNNSDQIEMQQYDYPTNQGRLITTQKFRDPSAWYHIVMRVDTTNSTADDRFRIYVNGEQVTSFGTRTNPSQNLDTWINDTTYNFRIGVSGPGGMKMDGYMTEINFVDGLSLDPSSFGYTESQTGLWRPKRYEGTYGTNGFYLDFLDNSSAAALGIDKSPNGNDYTVNNHSVSANLTNDSMPDTPSKNFCTLNPLNATSSINLPDGNVVFDQSSNDQAVTGTLGVTSGKWYWEVYKNASQNPEIGIETLTQRYSAQSTGSSNTEVAFITNNGEMRKGADSNSHSITGGSAQTGAGWIRIACDMDNKKIWFSDTSGNYFNSGNPATGANAAFDFSSVEVANGWTPYIFMGTGSGHNCYINFGQFDLNSFSSNIPTGFKTLNSKNLIPNVPSIIRPQKHFETLIYTGDGTAIRSISGLEFKPDLVWIKNRSQSDWHIWGDSVRGFPQTIYSNRSEAEVNGAGSGENGHIASAHDHGFVVKDDDGSVGGNCNANSENYVAWCWKAGGTASSNSDGSITSSVSANTEAGFSVVTWTGSGADASIGHGLGKKTSSYIC